MIHSNRGRRKDRCPRTPRSRPQIGIGVPSCCGQQAWAHLVPDRPRPAAFHTATAASVARRLRFSHSARLPTGKMARKAGPPSQSPGGEGHEVVESVKNRGDPLSTITRPSAGLCGMNLPKKHQRDDHARPWGSAKRKSAPPLKPIGRADRPRCHVHSARARPPGQVRGHRRPATASAPRGPRACATTPNQTHPSRPSPPRWPR